MPHRSPLVPARMPESMEGKWRLGLGINHAPADCSRFS